MKFSVITPSFNGMPSVKKCIGSVRNQAAFSDVQVEHLVQDGGSTDGTIEFLQKFDAEVRGQKSEDRCPRSEGDPSALASKATDNFRKEIVTTGNGSRLAPEAYSFSYSSEKDEGMYDAINKGWARADGDILSWLNADEQYLPGTLARVAEVFDNNPDVDAVYSDYIYVNSRGEPLAARREIPLRKRYITNGHLYAASCTLFYRRRLWNEGTLWLNTKYKYCADEDLVLRLLDSAKKIRHISEYLSLFQVIPGENLSSHEAMYLEHADVVKKHGFVPNRIRQATLMSIRRIERLVRACYTDRRLEYKYTTDESGDFIEINSHPKSIRFGYKDFVAG